MHYKVDIDKNTTCKYHIHLKHEILHRKVLTFYCNTTYKNCPPLVNDIFEEVPGIVAVTLAPFRVIILHSPTFLWDMEILPNVLELIRINLEPLSTSTRDIDSPHKHDVSVISYVSKAITHDK